MATPLSQNDRAAVDRFMKLCKDAEFAEILTVVLDELARRVNVVNVANGWFDDERTPMEDCMLLVTEVAEAAEAYRDDHMGTTVNENGKPEGWGSELADILIRLVDTKLRTDVDLGRITMQKLTYNASRGYRHGGKLK